jgi:indolepyruvate ferredoxin oxidoreductase beta subunit
MSVQEIPPMPVLAGKAAYPADIGQLIRAAGRRVLLVDAPALAVRAGDARASNTALLGAASRWLGGTEAQWDRALMACVKPRFLEANRAAFALGGEVNVLE